MPACLLPVSTDGSASSPESSTLWNQTRTHTVLPAVVCTPALLVGCDCGCGCCDCCCCCLLLVRAVVVLLGCSFFSLILSRMTVYSPRAPNTNMIHAITQASIAVRPSALGELVWIVLKMLISTKKIVTNRVMRPGITSGFTWGTDDRNLSDRLAYTRFLLQLAKKVVTCYFFGLQNKLKARVFLPLQLLNRVCLWHGQTLSQGNCAPSERKEKKKSCCGLNTRGFGMAFYT